MESLSGILARGKQRAIEASLQYAGALSPTEAHEILQKTAHAKLIDVRSLAELELVGRVPHALHLEWAFYPGMVPNADFAAQLEMQVDKESLVIFMCRTGGRSHNAATLASELGYAEAYNLLEGFEGQANTQKQRTLINGWRHAGLPWHN